MTPKPPSNNCTDCGLGHAVYICKLVLVLFSCFVALSNLKNGMCCQPASGVAISTKFGHNIASFSNHIQHIVSMGSKPEMIGIYAGWIVASGAIMADFHTIWNRSSVHHPRQSTGVDISRISRPSMHVPLSSSLPADPYPATVGSNYSFPKPSLVCFGKSLLNLDLRGNLVLHNSVCLICATLSAAHTAREHFCILAQSPMKSTV